MCAEWASSPELARQGQRLLQGGRGPVELAEGEQGVAELAQGVLRAVAVAELAEQREGALGQLALGTAEAVVAEGEDVEEPGAQERVQVVGRGQSLLEQPAGPRPGRRASASTSAGRSRTAPRGPADPADTLQAIAWRRLSWSRSRRSNHSTCSAPWVCGYAASARATKCSACASRVRGSSAAGAEPLGGELRDRLQQPVAHLGAVADGLGGHQGVLDEVGQGGERVARQVGADHLRGLQGEAAGEDAQPGEQRLRRVVEQLVAPRHGAVERAVPLRAGHAPPRRTGLGRAGRAAGEGRPGAAAPRRSPAPAGCRTAGGRSPRRRRRCRRSGRSPARRRERAR